VFSRPSAAIFDPARAARRTRAFVGTSEEARIDAIGGLWKYLPEVGFADVFPAHAIKLRQRALQDARWQGTVPIRNRHITPLARPRSRNRCVSHNAATLARDRRSLRIRATSARDPSRFLRIARPIAGRSTSRYATRPVARSISVKFHVHAPRDWKHCCALRKDPLILAMLSEFERRPIPSIQR